MKKEKIIICLLSLILAGCGNKTAVHPESTVSPLSEPVSESMAEPIAESESTTNIDALEDYTLIGTQTFDITLPSGAQAVFASYAPDSSDANVLFRIEQGGEALQTMEGYSGLADDVAHFLQVDAVGFADVNGDSYDDILIICSYAYTEGSGLQGNVHSASFYLGNGDDSFSFEAQLTRAANLWLEEEYSISSLKKYAAEYYAPTEDITGVYIYDNDGSTLSVTKNADGSYAAELNLFRLVSIDNFVGSYENNILTVAGSLDDENSFTAEITFSDGQAVFTFTESTWEYIESGTQMIFSRN